MKAPGRFCPDCGTPVGEGFQFCPSCGISLLSAVPDAAEKPVPRIVAPPPAREDASADERKAERRLVSVMFVDLVGFTAISEQSDPEDVREMQSRYFESARSIVARYGGSLEKFIGDAVMAVWGSPVARENDAERAVRAALELVRSVGSMGGGLLLGGKLAARAAVTTGEAAVSFDVENEGMVTGDLVNTASRLQEAADTGTVLVDDPTRRAVGDAGGFVAAGEKALKGKSTPVRAWHATEVSGPERTEAAAGHRGPFVGRLPELNTLLGLAASVAEERRTTLVSIIGVAGIGKSRLGREFELRTQNAPGVRWYRGRPPRWGQGSAFAPLGEMVRRSLGIAESEPAEVARRTLGEAVNHLIEDDAERAWIEPRVRVLLDPSEPVQTERDELFAAWRRYLEADAADGSMVLVFEDLQWADTETLDFIDYLATWSRRHPILVLTMARPELLERRPTWGAGIPQFRAMHLDRLTDAEVDELLHALAPDLPRDVAAEVRQRAEGVPLYAVEIARMMSELVAEGSPRVRTVHVPESLHALLAARIDALPERERSVLLMAAVLGRRFRPDALAALSGMDHRELGEIIGTLVRREFLVMDDEPRSPGRGQLSFVQDLTREIAYGTLSRHDRRRYHLAAIEYLEAAGDPETIEPIAEHLVAAHAAARVHEADAQALSDRALEALRQAADHAAGLHAPHRALGHLERALTLTDDARARAELAESAALVARAAARFAVAEVHLREAVGLRDSLGDAPAAARDRANLASVLLQAQHSDSAIAELEQAWEAYSATADSDVTLAHLAAELARAHMLRGDTQQAVEWAERAVRAAESNPAEAGPFATDARVSRGTALAQGGRADEGLAELQAAMQEAVDGGLAQIELRARTNITWLTASDDPRAAADTARRGLEIARQVGSREWWLQLLDIAGFVSVVTGEWDWALEALGEVAAADLPTTYRLDFAATRATIGALRATAGALEPLDRMGEPEPDLDPQALGWAELARAVAATVDGDLARGRDLAQAAAGRTVGLERAEALALSGRLAAWEGNRDAAASALAELESESLWGRAADARQRTLRAAVEGLGDGSAADELWEEALTGWRLLELPFAQALCLVDRWLQRGAEPDLTAARELLEGLGADGMLSLLTHLHPAGSASL
jgi:class 3 adenylate cyclase/tetratricopeptide (TPR) repeat protein